MWTGGTNTGVTAGSSGACSGSLTYDYDAFTAAFEIGLSRSMDSTFPIERGAVFGEYVKNVASNKFSSPKDEIPDSTGWGFGALIGDKKVDARAKWQFKYMLIVLGKDAWPDFLPDSDRLSGKTDSRGHKATIEYGLTKNSSIALTYYQSKRIQTADAQEHLVQADLNFRF